MAAWGGRRRGSDGRQPLASAPFCVMLASCAGRAARGLARSV
ncbi:putative lipoprotein [Bordetella pertussis STO1-CNMC-0004]|nr:putative lipoprotein [Bordetella pertussis H897]ETI05762.1 putative lipoprotein [Bordetella pertussis STO1-CNMC-0004]